MAVVVVPASLLFGDGLPDICCLTGEPTSTRMRVTFSTLRMPWMVLAAFLLSPLGAILAWILLARHASGTLAASVEVLRRRRRARIVTCTLAAVGLGLLVLGVVAESGPLDIVGSVILMVMAPVAARVLRRTYLPHAMVFDDGVQRLVRLANVHPGFGAALPS